MESTAKLADLKLVNKYYPPVSNYSYPRPETALRDDKPVGRSSVGSDCSAPGMTDDQESDISAEDANQYHVAGDELWDSFWEDTESLCSTQLEEEDQRADVNRNARYPALIPATLSRRKANWIPPWEGPRAAPRVEQGVVNREGAVSCWPLAVAEQPVTPISKASKASYSLFPQPTPTPILNLTPRRPSRPPRSGFLWESPPHFPLTPPQSSLGRPTKPKKLHLPTSDGDIKYHNTISITHSAPVSPTVNSPPPSTTTMILRRSEPNALAQQPRQLLNLPRICSDTTAALYSMNTNTASQETLTASATATAAAPAIPPRSPQRNQGRHSRQQSQLRNSVTAAELSSTSEQPQPQPKSHGQVPSTPRPSTDAQWPSTPPPPPPPPLPPSQQRKQQQQQQQQQHQDPQDMPLPVSVFELDSDSDEDVNFARRIVRNLTPHKRTRSATAVSRSRKGGDLAKEQLRRARAGTVTPSSTSAAPPQVQPQAQAQEPSPVPRLSEDKDKDSASVAMRRQRGEVLGRLFGGRWS